jgi:hypothetical protein
MRWLDVVRDRQASSRTGKPFNPLLGETFELSATLSFPDVYRDLLSNVVYSVVTCCPTSSARS